MTRRNATNRCSRTLTERGENVGQAAGFKRTSDDVRAPQRVEQVIARVVALAREAGADPVVTERVYRAMIGAFIEAELSEHAALGEQAQAPSGAPGAGK
ncbi:chorismate mutase [Arhodomonas sp. AD133]|uniref:chorismate mutase n=1 Tax=Arhodomonas sp. AD133 TaxID=3415009 RepID=UPI003EBC1476